MNDRTDPLRLRRHPERGHHDRDTANRVLDAGMVCHVGFADGEQPLVIPMLYARDGDRLLLHGSVASRLLRTLAGGAPVCVTVTHLDGLVLAASVFDHSVNYRSVVILGQAREISDPDEKASCLDRLVEYMVPGRTRDARPGNRKEVNATTLLELPIENFSVKIRAGGAGAPGPEDSTDVWTGVIPIVQCAGDSIPENASGDFPEHLRDGIRKRFG